uniref:hypothetical protein n=1 Tax=Verrucomicrobium spinosum TaxID=2736 RepID=UPI000B11EE6D
MRPDFLFASWFDIIAACSATLSVLVGGSYFMERSVNSLRQGILHMDTPIALGIALAWLGSMAGWLAGGGPAQVLRLRGRLCLSHAGRALAPAEHG